MLKKLTPTQREQVMGYSALLGGIVLFSTVEVASKSLGTGAPPLLLAGIRFIISGLTLGIPSIGILRMRAKPFSRSDWWILLGLALFGVAFSIGLFHLAIPLLQANIAAILFSANPAFVILFSPFILGEKATPRKIAGVLAGIAGMGVLAFQGSAISAKYVLGLVLMAGSLITFALYTVLTKKVMSRFGSVVLVCITNIIGGVALLVTSIMVEGNPLPHLATCSWPGILYLSVIATALAYWAYFFGIINIGASKGSMFFFLKPILASLFAWVFLGEVINMRIVTGAVFVIAALILALAPSRKIYIPE